MSLNFTNIDKINAPPPMDSGMFYLAIVQFCISSIGLPLNTFLIFCMLKNKQLRATCCTSFLLVLALDNWLCEFLIISIPSPLVFSAQTISISVCFPLGTLSYFANSYAQTLIFLISADRIISIIFPFCYDNFAKCHRWKYMYTLLTIPLLWISIFIYNSYLYMLANPNRQVFCMPTDPISPSVNSYNFYFVTCFNATAFLIYTTIWMLIKCKAINLLQNSVEQRVLKSLSVLMVITFFFGLPGPLSANFLLPYLKVNQDTQNLVFRAFLQLNKIVQTVNGPVLFLYSSDFQLVMKKELRTIFGQNKIKPILVRSNEIALATNNSTIANGNGPQILKNLT